MLFFASTVSLTVTSVSGNTDVVLSTADVAFRSAISVYNVSLSAAGMCDDSAGKQTVIANNSDNKTLLIANFIVRCLI